MLTHAQMRSLCTLKHRSKTRPLTSTRILFHTRTCAPFRTRALSYTRVHSLAFSLSLSLSLSAQGEIEGWDGQIRNLCQDVNAILDKMQGKGYEHVEAALG